MLAVTAAAAIASLGQAACSQLVRLAAGPSLDTRGGVSVEARLSASLGAVGTFDHDTKHVRHPSALVLTATGTVAARDVGRSSARAVGGVDAGIEYAYTAPHRGDVGFHAGLLTAIRNDALGVSLDAAVPFTFYRAGPTDQSTDSRVHLALGPMAVVSLSGEDGYPPVATTERYEQAVGRFGLGASFELYRLTQYTIR